VNGLGVPQLVLDPFLPLEASRVTRAVPQPLQAFLEDLPMRLKDLGPLRKRLLVMGPNG
jgi:hypothetical protein